MAKSTLLDKVIYLNFMFGLIQPERIIWHYFPVPKIIIAIPTPIFYLLIIMWLLAKKRENQTKIPLFELLIFLVFCIGISSLFAHNTGRARVALFPRIYSLLFYYIVLSYYIDSDKKFNKLLALYFCSFIIFGILGLTQGGKLPFIPQLDDEDALGPFYTMALAFPAFLSQIEQDRLKKYFYVSLTMLCIVIIIYTQARGAFIAMIAVLIYILIKSPNKFKIIISAIMVSVIIYGTIWSSLKSGPYVQEIMSIFSEHKRIERRVGTGASRIFLWKMGFKIFLTSPIIGIGPLNFGVHLPDYAEKHRDEQVGLAYYGQILHNDYMEMLVGTGVVGFMVYFALFAGSFRMNRTTRKILRDMDIQQNEKNGECSCMLFRGYLKKYYYLTLAFEASQIAFMINIFFYGLLYYDKFYWNLLLMSAALHVAVVSAYKKANRSSQGERFHAT